MDISNNSSFKIFISDEDKFKSTYPKVGMASQGLVDISEQDMSTYAFVHCAVYEDDPYTFVVLYSGIGDNNNNILIGLTYSPDGTLTEAAMEVVIDWEL
jgi:hypothetical protein